MSVSVSIGVSLEQPQPPPDPDPDPQPQPHLAHLLHPVQSPFNGGQKYAGGTPTPNPSPSPALQQTLTVSLLGGSCEGSTVSLPAAGGVGDLVFSTPFSISARANMTLFKSTDSGASWQWLKQVHWDTNCMLRPGHTDHIDHTDPD